MTTMQTEGNKVDDDNTARSKVDGWLSDSDRFYEKLGEFFDSTGLSLIFNVRETILDLFVLYKEVTNRGGYHQITNKGIWSDVVSALKLEAKDSNLATQLQRLYANLLYQFEQTYISNAPRRLTGFSGYKNSINKQDLSSSSQLQTDNNNGPHPVQKKMRIEPVILPGGVATEQKPKRRVAKKDPNAPTGHRSAYQIFLKRECDRLKSIHGALDGKIIRKMAVDMWQHLSEKDKQPYIEESRKDKERFQREMTAYNNSKNSEVEAQIKKPDKDVYHVIVGLGQKAENNPIPENKKPNKDVCNVIVGIGQEAENSPIPENKKPEKDIYDVIVGIGQEAENNSIPENKKLDKDVYDVYNVIADIGQEAENGPIPDQSMVDLAIKMMKNAPSDHLLGVNWDEFSGELDLSD